MLNLPTLDIMPNSQLILYMPKILLDLDGDGSGQCNFSHGEHPDLSHSCTAFESADPDYYEVQTESVLSSLSTDEVTLMIQGMFSNPISALMSDISIQIKIVNGESLIAETPQSSSLFVVPPL